MSRGMDHEELWSRFVVGEELSPDEEERLLQLIRADQGLLDELFQDGRLDGLLRSMGIGPATEDEFVRRFLGQLTASRDATRFVKRVESQLRTREFRPSEAPRNGPLPDRPSTRRRHPVGRNTTRQGNPDGVERLLASILTAAGLLFGVIILIALSTSGSHSGERGKGAGVSGSPKRTDREAGLEQSRKRQLEVGEGLHPVQERRTILVQQEPAQDAQSQEKRSRDALEKDLASVIEPAGKASERTRPPAQGEADVASSPEPSRTPDLETKKAPSSETVVAVAQKGRAGPPVAKLECVEGEVTIVRGADKSAAKVGDALNCGQGLATSGAKSRARIAYPDKTWLELGGETEVTGLHHENGKTLTLERGMLLATVARQPATQPMLIATPHSKAMVVGTTLRLVVTPGETGATYLEVLDGKVQLTRCLDGKTVVVSSGHSAMAAVGLEFKANPIGLGLVGHWRFDEIGRNRLSDSSGLGQTAKLFGGAWTEGRQGGGLRFSSAKDYVELPNSKVLRDLQLGSYTLAAWFKPDAELGSDNAFIIMKPGYDTSLGFRGSALTMWTWFKGEDARHASAQVKLEIGTFYHVAGTVDMSRRTISVYLDGRLLSTGELPPNSAVMDYGDATWKVGGVPVNNPRRGPIRGVVDDVRFYNRALSGPEIRALCEQR